MDLRERQKRILARGEFSDHCHVLTGDVEFTPEGRILVGENSGAVIKHLIESAWLEGKEVWTKEHKDISIESGEYVYVPQIVFDPLTSLLEEARD